MWGSKVGPLNDPVIPEGSEEEIVASDAAKGVANIPTLSVILKGTGLEPHEVEAVKFIRLHQPETFKAYFTYPSSMRRRALKSLISVVSVLHETVPGDLSFPELLLQKSLTQFLAQSHLDVGWLLELLEQILNQYLLKQTDADLRKLANEEAYWNQQISKCQQQLAAVLEKKRKVAEEREDRMGRPAPDLEPTDQILKGLLP